MGITVDLVLQDTYSVMPEEEVVLDPKDEKLLEEDFGNTTDRKRSQKHAKILSWMRRPDYISTEQTRFQPTTIEKIESRVGFAVRKKLGTDQDIYMDRDAQVNKIEKTFDDANLDITTHHSKPGVVPEAIFPILPDTQMWKFPCAQVIFDSDPAPLVRLSNFSSSFLSFETFAITTHQHQYILNHFRAQTPKFRTR